MMPEDIQKSFDKVQTNPGQREILLAGIKKRANTAPSAPKPIWRHAMIPVAACSLLAVIALSVWVFPKGGFSGLFKQTDSNNDLPPEVVDDNYGERDDMGDMLSYTQFGVKGRQYLPLSEDNEWGIPLTVSNEDIGEKIADIQNASDSALVGSGVYRYTKRPGEAIVAAEIDGAWQLFRFFIFDSYGANADEDALAYLELFGIESASDIAKIELIRYTEEAKADNRLNVVGCIEMRDDIDVFYNHYSVIKDSSAAYFDKLFAQNGGIEDGRTPGQTGQTEPVPPDAPDNDPAPPDTAQTIETDDQPAYADDQPADDGREPLYDYGDESSGGESIPGNSGAAGLLNNQVTVRIHAQSGLYYDAVYYPDMGFISRHEVSDAFARFLAGYIDGTAAASNETVTADLAGEWVYTKSTQNGASIEVYEFSVSPPAVEIADSPKTMLSFEDIVLTGTIKASFYENVRVGILQKAEGQSFRITNLSVLAEGDVSRQEEDEFLQYDPASGLLRYALSGTDVHHYFVRKSS